MIHISFFSSFSFHFLPLFLFRMPQTGSSPVCGLLFCTYAKNRRTAQSSSPVRLSKKVRNRQNQAANKRGFTESEDWILRSVFSIKPTDSVIARRAQFLRPTRQSLTKRFVIPKRNMVARNEAANLIFCNKLILFASCSRASPRDAIPSPLRLPRPRCGLAMTRN